MSDGPTVDADVAAVVLAVVISGAGADVVGAVAGGKMALISPLTMSGFKTRKELTKKTTADIRTGVGSFEMSNFGVTMAFFKLFI